MCQLCIQSDISDGKKYVPIYMELTEVGQKLIHKYEK